MSTDEYDNPPYFDEGDDALDPDGPSAADIERFGDDSKACPECGSDVYDQTEMCPSCGYVFEEPSGAQKRWVVVVAAVVIVAFLLVVLL